MAERTPDYAPATTFDQMILEEPRRAGVFIGPEFGTVSRPFPLPAGGRIAVKVINHLGDEVMKVVRA